MKRILFLLSATALAASVVAAPVSAGPRPSAMTATCGSTTSSAGGAIPTGTTTLQFGWAIQSGTFTTTPVSYPGATSATTPANAMTVAIAAMKGTRVLATAYASCPALVR